MRLRKQVSFGEREDDMRGVVGLGTNQSFNRLRYALAMSRQWSNADNKSQARFQVRKTLAAAKAESNRRAPQTTDLGVFPVEAD